jgi:RimJ/RimL family protein N-acetyltransferase
MESSEDPISLPMNSIVSLRHVETGDLPVFFAHQSDPVAHRLAAFVPRDRDSFMAHWTTKVLGNPDGVIRTILLGGRGVGNVGAWTDPEAGERLLGYWVGREFWGRGVATAAVILFLESEPARPLVAHVAAHNLGSMRVLEKAGFARAREAVLSLPDGSTDRDFVYVLQGHP